MLVRKSLLDEVDDVAESEDLRNPDTIPASVNLLDGVFRIV